MISRIYADAAADQVSNAVVSCLRLARSINDRWNSVRFLREIIPNSPELRRLISTELDGCSVDEIKRIDDSTFEEWLHTRTMSYVLGDDPSKNILAMTIGEIEADINSLSKEISEKIDTRGMDPFDAAAFTDRRNQRNSQFRLKLAAEKSIQAKIKASCLSYASKIESRLAAEENTESFLSEIQEKVNNYFSERSDSVYQKLIKASSLIGSKNSEDQALLLTCVRRLIKSVSDFFYPPRTDDIICSDGVVRKLGEEQYLNRLQEFCKTKLNKSTGSELIIKETEYLMAFARKLNDMASKGVHSSVSYSESKQGLVGIYLLLSNLIEYTKDIEQPKSTI